MAEGRQTALLNVYLDELKVEKPPFDEQGVIQDFVGRGVTREIDPIKKANEITEDTVGDFIQSAEEMIGPFRDSFKLIYTLQVKSLSKRGARIWARTFIRAKNPFEADIIEIRSVEKNENLSIKRIGTVWEVEASVTK